MTEQLIGTVRFSAPLFNKATLEELLFIVQKLSDASYHYADDSGSEFGSGSAALNAAACECEKLQLSYDALVEVHKHAPQLVTFSQFIDRVLRKARA